MSAADFATIREALGWAVLHRCKACKKEIDAAFAALARVEADTLTAEEALVAQIPLRFYAKFAPESPTLVSQVWADLLAKLERIAGGGWSKPTDADIERGQELAKEHGW